MFDEAFVSRFPDLAGAELNALLELAEASQADESCRPIDRGEWPAVCESRIAHDLRQLRTLAGSVPAFSGVPS